jgi:hypothetical protein
MKTRTFDLLRKRVGGVSKALRIIGLQIPNARWDFKSCQRKGTSMSYSKNFEGNLKGQQKRDFLGRKERLQNPKMTPLKAQGRLQSSETETSKARARDLKVLSIKMRFKFQFSLFQAQRSYPLPTSLPLDESSLPGLFIAPSCKLLPPLVFAVTLAFASINTFVLPPLISFS